MSENKIFAKNFYLRLGIILLIIIFLLFAIDGKLNDWAVVRDFLKEFIIVIGAAILVSLYFERRLRKEISEEFNSILEAKEEFAKAGIVKYYSNFLDVDFRSYLDRDLNAVDFYLTYGRRLFGNIEDKLKKLCTNKNTNINIYILSKENPFLEPLGQLWGRTNIDYKTDKLKEHIDATINLLTLLFNDLKSAGSLKATVKVYGLKRHPVFHSFYRFDDEIIFVPSKIIEEKDFVPPAFLTKKTIHSEGIYNKCMYELNDIARDASSIEMLYDSTHE